MSYIVLCFLYISLQPVHVHGAVVPVLSLVVRRVGVFLLLQRPEALLQLHEASHLLVVVVLPAARGRGLEASVLLVLVGHHLLDAYHGLSLTDQRHLENAMIKEEGITYLSANIYI